MTSTQKLPKRNHYVPQFYLKGFSQDEQNIHRFDKVANDIKLLPIPVVGFQKDLYTFKTKYGTVDSLEDLFSQIEGLAAATIQKLKDHQDLSVQEKADLSIFLSLQMVRTPAFQNQMLSSHTELTKKIMRMSMKMTPPEYIQDFFKQRGQEMTKEEVEDLIDFGANEDRSEIKIEYPQGFWINHMLKLAMDTCPIFQICNWEIRHSVTKFGFLTSDHPFMLIPGKNPRTFGVGLLTGNAKKVIPLAADICLIAHEPSNEPTLVHTVADKHFMRQINKCSIGNAEAYVFSPSPGKVEKLIKQDKQLLKIPRRYSVD